LVRSTRILHQNEEYLIQDNQASTASRAITFLARPGSKAGSGPSGFKPIRTNHGDWIPVAKWEQGNFELLTEGSRALSADLESILNRYLNHHKDGNGKTRRKRYYYIERKGKPNFSLSISHPYGLAIQVFTHKDLAREDLLEDSDTEADLRIRQTDDVKSFFIRAADEGYAGAILDNEQPIYFCLDAAENMVFLKLALDSEEKVEEWILQENGLWDKYVGDKDIEFYLDQDNCDRNMVNNLGEIPFLGHRDTDFVWTVEEVNEEDRPYVLPTDDGPWKGLPGGNSILLFQNREQAMDFIRDRALMHCEAVRVDNLKSFLRSARHSQLNVLLEPFNHRASSATLWLDEDQIVLDTFSGFWILNDAWKFVRVD